MHEFLFSRIHGRDHDSCIRSIGNGQYGHSIEVCVSSHTALRISLPLCQPVSCIFWPVRMLNWLVAASQLHNIRAPCCTAEWPYCPFATLWLNALLYNKSFMKGSATDVDEKD